MGTPSTPGTTKSRMEAKKIQVPTKVTSPRSDDVQLKKPTIKEEILIHTSVPASKPTFTAKTTLDLKRIVSDQWRKDIMNKQLNEETLRLESIKQKHVENQQKQAEILQRRKEKLKGRPTAELGPIVLKLSLNSIISLSLYCLYFTYITVC